MFIAGLVTWALLETHGNLETAALIMVPGFALLGVILWTGREKKLLTIDSAGLTDPRSGAWVSWAEIAAIELRETLVGGEVEHRLVVEAQPESLFEERAQRRHLLSFRKHDRSLKVELDHVRPGLREAIATLESRSERPIPIVKVKIPGPSSSGVIGWSLLLLGSVILFLSVWALVAEYDPRFLLGVVAGSVILFGGIAVYRRHKRFEAGAPTAETARPAQAAD